MKKESHDGSDDKSDYCIRCGVEMEPDAHIGLLCRQCAWEVDNANATELMAASLTVEEE